MAQIENDENITDHGPRKPRSGRGGSALSDCGASSVVITRKPHKLGHKTTTLKISESRIRLGTWNVNSLYAAGKLSNLVQEVKRLKINMIGISELRWPGSGTCKQDGGTLYYSGSVENDSHHRNGVGIFITSEFTKYVKNFIPISDRMALLQLNSKPFNMNIIQVYAPTAEKKYDNEIEPFYCQLKETLRSLKKNEVTYIVGDFNAKIGQGQRSDLVGEYGLGECNARGDRLYQFCQEHDMIIANTWFKLHERRLYTWKGPGDNPLHIIRNQIDYILVNKRFRNGVRRVTTYPGADIGSDHNPLIADIKIKLKKVQKSPTTLKLNITDDNKIRIEKDINSQLSQIKREVNSTEIWNTFKDHISKIIEKHSETSPRYKKQQWMTDEILDLMKERRQQKNNMEKYKQIQKIIKQKIRVAKEKWMKDKCIEMEEFQDKHDTFNMFKKVREIAGLYNKKTPHILMDSTGRIIIDEEEIRTTWYMYIKELYNDSRPEEQMAFDEGEGPEILMSEVIHATKLAKNKKAVGPDNIPAEMLKLINEENIGILVKLFNHVYSTAEIPEDWLKSEFITLPKKQRPKHCSDYRLISLMSHTMKIFLRIIHGRIRNKCEEDQDETQFGFRNGLGTREALFALNVLLQKCRDQRKDVFAVFIDYEKAFDRVKHDKLIKILREKGVDSRDVRIIEKLYWRQRAGVRINGKSTEECKILRGVRQGCILSPLLFNLYSDEIFKQALHNLQYGVKINGRLINTIRYADDTVILCDDLNGLQCLLYAIDRVGREMGLNINCSKTKYMVFSRLPYHGTQLQVNGQMIQRVSSFKYLGCYITTQLDPDKEIKCRIEVARATFFKMRPLFCNDNLKLQLRKRMIKCYIWSVLLYGVEAWTLKISTINRLEAFEMWLYRRMLKIPWTAMQTNEAVLNRANAVRELVDNIKCRKIAYLGHILRGSRYNILQLIMMGKIEGRRGIGRKQVSWLKNIREWTGIREAEQLFRIAQDRESFAMLIADVKGT